VQEPKLFAPEYPGNVGSNVSIDAGTAILGDNGEGYIFRLAGGSWAYSTSVQPEGNVDYSELSVGTSHDYAVIGTSNTDFLSGAAYVFSISPTDCNSNGIADPCDTATGTSFDCDNNAQPDECQIDPLFVAVSEAMSPIGVDAPQTFTIAAPPAASDDVVLTVTARADLGSETEWLDVDINGLWVGTAFAEPETDDCPESPELAEIVVPSATWNAAIFETDASVTLTATDDVDPDLCESSFVTVLVEYQKEDVDCNRNGVLDTCDILSGVSTDCDGDGVADECQLSPRYLAASGLLSPIGYNSPQEYVLQAPPAAIGDVLLIFEAVADLASSVEWIDVDIDGTALGSVFVTGPADDCPPIPAQDQLLVAADTFNAAAGDGEGVIHLLTTDEVSDTLCDESFITVTIDYPVASTLEDCNANDVLDTCEMDCNGNARPDECDLADGSSADCNGNIVPDECDVTGGASSDCDRDGVPDECQPDCNTNGIADPCDIASGTSQDCGPNGTPDECEPDCNSNSQPDGCDVSSGASNDCNANSVPDECEPTVCPGDANLDCAVDPLDVGFVSARFGCIYPQDGEFCLTADVNSDGVVDPLDAGYVQARFGICP